MSHLTQIQFLWFEFDSFFAFRGWFQNLSTLYQVLIMAGLVALTVACISLAYYITKYAIKLAIEIVKAAFNLIRSIFHGITHQPRTYVRPPRAPRPIRAPRPPRAHRPIRAPRPPRAHRPIRAPQPPSPAAPNVDVLHCPMCGEQFTPEMMGLLNHNNAVFCEYCGHKLEQVYN